MGRHEGTRSGVVFRINDLTSPKVVSALRDCRAPKRSGAGNAASKPETTTDGAPFQVPETERLKLLLVEKRRRSHAGKKASSWEEEGEREKHRAPAQKGGTALS